MKYITEINSETGKKFQELLDKANVCKKQARDFSKKYGFNEYRGGNWAIWGGISSCLDFKETPNPKIWGKGAKSGEFMPKRNSKAGKSIDKEIKKLLTIESSELNACVGMEGEHFKTIGFTFNNDKYFGIKVDEKWNVKMPDDCVEVTVGRYNEIFN